jgi:tetratricopeptide (TPR) repeat protein
VASWKYWSAGLEGSADETDAERRREIAEFWAAYHEATRLRVALDYESAIEAYRRAVERRPNHEESWYYLGNCLFELGDYAHALEAYRRLVTVNPESLRGCSQLGVVLATWAPGGLPDPAAAKAAFLRSLELDPEDSGTYLRLGLLEIRAGMLDDALEHFLKAAGSASAEGMFRAGYVHLLKGNTAAARDYFQKVLATAELEKQIANRGARVEGDTRRHETPAGAPGTGAPPPSANPPSSGPAPAAKTGWAPLREAAVLAKFLLGRLEAEVPPLDSAGRLPAAPRWVKGLDASETGILRLEALGSADPAVEAGSWVDLDGDHQSDLVYIRNRQFWWAPTREGQLQSPVCLGDAPAGVMFLTWGDLDGDGRPDAVGYGDGPGGSPMYWLRQTGNRDQGLRLEESPFPPGLEVRRQVLDALAVDLDGDGRDDLVEAGPGTPLEPALRVWFFRGGRFEAWEPLGILPAESASGTVPKLLQGTVPRLLAQDLDGDGRIDVLVLRWRRPPVVLWNKGGGHLEPSPLEGVPSGALEAPALALLDFDDDGRTDVVVGRRAGYGPAIAGLTGGEPAPPRQSLLWLRNEGGRHFRDVSERMAGGLGFGVLDLAAADADGDGRRDLLVLAGDLAPGAARLEPGRILLNQGAGSFQPDLLLPPVVSSGPLPRLAVGPRTGKGGRLLFIPGTGVTELVRGAGAR